MIVLMDDPDCRAKPCKVWNYDRRIRKSCVAPDISSLKDEGKRKLNINYDESVRVVLEEDGTEVDDNEYFQLLPDHSTFLLLRNHENWMPRISFCETNPTGMCCGDEGSLRRSSVDRMGQPCTDSTDSAGTLIDSPKNRASHLLDQLCTGNAYKQLLPWLLLRPVDLEEIVNADPEQLAIRHPRDTVDAIQEMSHKALMDYNNAQKAVELLNVYDRAVRHTGRTSS